MYLVQILLPLYTNDGKRIRHAQFQKVKRELTEEFQGLTAYSRSVAEGFWKTGRLKHRDEIIVYEVMMALATKNVVEENGEMLERRFQQETIVIRAQKIRLL